MENEFTTIREAIDHFEMMKANNEEAASHLALGVGKELAAKHARQYGRLIGWLEELERSREELACFKEGWADDRK